jgi:hypothetical protein
MGGGRPGAGSSQRDNLEQSDLPIIWTLNMKREKKQCDYTFDIHQAQTINNIVFCNCKCVEESQLVVSVTV